jgi:transcriptional regulator with XRE-family HTH domain
MKKFAELLKIARSKKNLTQRELAKLAGVGYVQICKYETGKALPRPKVVSKIAGTLGVPESYFDAPDVNILISDADLAKDVDWLRKQIPTLENFERQSVRSIIKLVKKSQIMNLAASNEFSG